MDYQDFRARWDQAKGPVLDLVHRVETALGAAAPPTPESLVRDFATFPFDRRVWAAWLGNTEKLQGVKRLDRFPYATHPTRMAMICLWVLGGGAAADDAAVLALLHDYLEEGDGLHAAGLEAMRRRFPDEPKACLAGVVLSEPVIDYVSLGRSSELSYWRRVAYVLQARDAIERLGEPSFADAALADKLDNLHDLDYVALDPRLSPAKRASKLADRLGFFRFVARRIGPLAAPNMAALLDAGIAQRSAELGVDAALMEAAAQGLEERALGQGSAILKMTRAYQLELGLSLSSSSSG